METLLGKHWHAIAAQDVEGFLESDLATGLDRFEVRRRQGHFGPNVITARKKRIHWSSFCGNSTRHWFTS